MSILLDVVQATEGSLGCRRTMNGAMRKTTRHDSASSMQLVAMQLVELIQVVQMLLMLKLIDCSPVQHLLLQVHLREIEALALPISSRRSTLCSGCRLGGKLLLLSA